MALKMHGDSPYFVINLPSPFALFGSYTLFEVAIVNVRRHLFHSFGEIQMGCFCTEAVVAP